MPGLMESVQWNACMHRLDLGLYSHLKEFVGNVNFKGKIPFTKCSEDDQTHNTESRRTASPTHN